MAAGRPEACESVQYARVLADTGVAYISVMGEPTNPSLARRDPGFQKRKVHGRSGCCRKKAGEGAGHSRRQDLHRSFRGEPAGRRKGDLIGLQGCCGPIPSGRQKSKREERVRSFTAHRSAMTPAPSLSQREGRFCVRWPHDKLQEWKAK